LKGLNNNISNFEFTKHQSLVMAIHHTYSLVRVFYANVGRALNKKVMTMK